MEAIKIRFQSFCFSLAMFMLCYFNSHAQNEIQFSLNQYNQSVLFPASIGLDNYLHANFEIKSQWNGITGHPLFQNLNFNSPVLKWNSGIGLNINNQQEGALQILNASGVYSYHIAGEHHFISFGIRGGIIESVIDGTKLIAPEGNYLGNNIDHNDPILPITPLSSNSFDLSAGLSMGTKHFKLDASALHLLNNNLLFSDGKISMNLGLTKTYCSMISYSSSISKSIRILANASLKTDLKDFQSDINLISQISHSFIIGMGLRGYNSTSFDAMISNIGYQIKPGILVCYSYDFPLSSITSVSSGSQDFLIVYQVLLMKPPKVEKIIFTPRF